MNFQGTRLLLAQEHIPRATTQESIQHEKEP
jgi:hypothetical protein